MKLNNPEALRDPANRHAVEDLIALCELCAGNGLSLKPVDPYRTIAVPGEVVKKGKGWEWVQLADNTFFDAVLGLHKWETGMSPKELMVHFASL